MQCHESPYAGFSSSLSPKRYKTVPRPANSVSANVRTLRPALMDDGNTGTATAETTNQESAISLDGYAMAACVWIVGYMLHLSGSKYFIHWAAITFIAILCTQKYARQWVVSLAILLLVKSYLLP